jgi:hypothetical protein
MDNSVKVTAMILGTIVILALIGVAVYFQIKPSQTVNVQGLAEVKAVPDKVAIYFSVITEGETSKEANDKNAEIVDNAITELVKLGFERKEITTENFNIYPKYSWSNRKQEIIGYQASHTLKVEFSSDKTDKIGDAIDAGVNAGAGISYINFELSLDKQNEYKKTALEQATLDARSKAEGIASGLGKNVGRVVSISSSDFGYYPWRLYEAAGVEGDIAMAKEATTNIQPGEQTISAQVVVVYALK